MSEANMQEVTFWMALPLSIALAASAITQTTSGFFVRSASTRMQMGETYGTASKGSAVGTATTKNNATYATGIPVFFENLFFSGGTCAVVDGIESYTIVV